MDKKENRLLFFDYVRLAKKEYRHLLDKYPDLEQLSSREMEVFHQLLTEKTQTDIATELYVSPSAVHFHCKNIYRKLSISNRKQLLIKYKEICTTEADHSQSNY